MTGDAGRDGPGKTDVGEAPRPVVLRTVSADGTSIGCHVTGSGPPLVLVHGTGDTWMRWSAVIPELSRHFQVYAMDRRGRGMSGDDEAYSLDREVEDVQAVIVEAEARARAGSDGRAAPSHEAGAVADGRPYLIGHSFGGICALEAALRTPVGKLVLYEPPIMLSGETLHDAFLARIDDLLARGKREEIWVSFLKDVMRMSDQEVAQYRSSRSWNARVEMARVLPREARARGSYRFEAGRFRSFMTPTLLLGGSMSPRELHAAVDMLASALPRNRIAVMQGESHVAMSSAPELFLREVVSFLEE